MLEAAIQAAPPEKWKTAADYVFLLTFEQRQSSSAFVMCFIGAFYGYFSLKTSERFPIHFLFAILSICMALANLSHATGFSLFGYNPMVTSNGMGVGVVLTPFWIVAAYLNIMGYLASKKAAAAALVSKRA